MKDNSLYKEGKPLSFIIPICSKQISYLLYNDSTHELHAQYHNGEIKSFTSVTKDIYDSLVQSENRYDDFIQFMVSAK